MGCFSEGTVLMMPASSFVSRISPASLSIYCFSFGSPVYAQTFAAARNILPKNSPAANGSVRSLKYEVTAKGSSLRKSPSANDPKTRSKRPLNLTLPGSLKVILSWILANLLLSMVVPAFGFDSLVL